jgi:hypothetical protein
MNASEMKSSESNLERLGKSGGLDTLSRRFISLPFSRRREMMEVPLEPVAMAVLRGVEPIYLR